MTAQMRCGFLVLDRKGEYIEDTEDQRGNTVYGLQNHSRAVERLVVVSRRPGFDRMKGKKILDYLEPQFNIRDVDPIDLADFLPTLTPQQAVLIRGYAHIESFYEKLLAETQFGAVDKGHWYQHFPGLFDLKDSGKKLLSKFEEEAKKIGRDELTDDEHDRLQEHLGGSDSGVLARAAGKVKRFCSSPFFGGSYKGRSILGAPSCVKSILDYLASGKIVCIDMRGQSDEAYTMVAALFARRLLKANKDRPDDQQIRACIVMEEAHNILGEDELAKGHGTGSVFIELAREGRSFKLGFVLVTQQPDPQSIAAQVVKTIDTVVSFNMPPEDAKHLRRLKPGFADLELVISNAPEFQGVAISDGGPVFFSSAPVDKEFMKACVDGSIEKLFVGRDVTEPDDPDERETIVQLPSIEDRLSTLMRQRQRNIQPVALATMQAWRREEDPLESREDEPF